MFQSQIVQPICLRVPFFLHKITFSSKFSVSEPSNYKCYRKNIINPLETNLISGITCRTHGFKLQDLILPRKLWVLLADIQVRIMLKNNRQNHKQEISLDEAAGKSMQKEGRLSHYKKYSKAKKSWQHLASTGKASKEDNNLTKILLKFEWKEVCVRWPSYIFHTEGKHTIQSDCVFLELQPEFITLYWWMGALVLTCSFHFCFHFVWLDQLKFGYTKFHYAYTFSVIILKPMLHDVFT